MLSLARIWKTRRRLAAGTLAIVVGGILLGLCSTSPALPVPTSSSATNTPTATPTTRHSGPEPHIMVLVMENQSYDQIIGNSAAP